MYVFILSSGKDQREFSLSFSRSLWYRWTFRSAPETPIYKFMFLENISFKHFRDRFRLMGRFRKIRETVSRGGKISCAQNPRNQPGELVRQKTWGFLEILNFQLKLLFSMRFLRQHFLRLVLRLKRYITKGNCNRNDWNSNEIIDMNRSKSTGI